ncbi:hypothetical protein [Legionella pneumophila]|uniref:hypothetical protein n=1 Tax=Legionella pneumophila TaxID=446 RepID=UPI00165182FB|nr:hypothetical protein [Legionella pneumophila]
MTLISARARQEGVGSRKAFIQAKFFSSSNYIHRILNELAQLGETTSWLSLKR